MTAEADKILAKIVELGKSEDFSGLTYLFSSSQEYQNFLQIIQHKIKNDHNAEFLHYYDIFSLLGDMYNFEDLTSLIKGLTIVENNNKIMGSVSPVIGLYSKLVEKVGLRYSRTGDKFGIHLLINDLTDIPNKAIEDITHWILQKSENVYLPFGISTLKSKTIHDIRIELETWVQRQKDIAIRDENQKKENEERSNLKKIESEKYKNEHHQKNIEQREYREYINSLNTSQLLQVIMSDNERPIYFYANELNNIGFSSITEIDKEIIKVLIKRFKQLESGQIKRLKGKLTTFAE